MRTHTCREIADFCIDIFAMNEPDGFDLVQDFWEEGNALWEVARTGDKNQFYLCLLDGDWRHRDLKRFHTQLVTYRHLM